MGKRMDGLARLVVGGLYTFLFLVIIAPILLFVGLVLAGVDIVWQIVVGSEGIAPNNLFRDAWMAQIQNLTWAFTGEGEFQLTIFG